MLARFVVNAVSLAIGAGFTLGLFLSIAHFLDQQESSAGAQVVANDLETIAITMPPPPPPPKPEEKPVVASELVEAVALGLAEEPSTSPVTIAPSPLNPEELLPMRPPPTQAISVAVNLESSFTPTMNLALDENRIYQKSEVDQLPFATSRPDPPVPESLLGEGRKRSVVVLFVVDAHGVVSNVRILHSSNNSEFDSIIAETLQEWTFSPAIRKGKPVRCMIQQQITVELGHRDIFSL